MATGLRRRSGNPTEFIHYSVAIKGYASSVLSAIVHPYCSENVPEIYFYHSEKYMDYCTRLRDLVENIDYTYTVKLLVVTVCSPLFILWASHWMEMDLGDLFHDVAYNIQLVVNTRNPLVDIMNQA